MQKSLPVLLQKILRNPVFSLLLI